MKFLKRFKKVSRIGVVPPVPAEGRHGLAIAAIVKNEAPYLAEWIEFHRLVGVRSFYIYDNGSTDDSVSVAKKHIGDDGMVVPFAGQFEDQRLKRPINMQILAFSHAISNFGATHRWMMFTDPDEYLIPKTGGSITEILDRDFADEVNISIPWFMFGPNGHEATPEGLTIENFTSRFDGEKWPHTNFPFKFICDPCETIELNNHNCATRRDGQMTCNDEGEKAHNNERKNDAFFSSKHFQLNHYFTRSIEELRLRKMGRGRISDQGQTHSENAISKTLDLIGDQYCEDDLALSFVPQLKSVLGQ